MAENNTNLTAADDWASGNVSRASWRDSMVENPFDNLYIRTIFIVLYGSVFAACVIGNILVLIVIARHRKMRNITNFFLANLAVSDLCVGVFCVIPALASYLSPYWYLGKVMCKLYYFMQCASYTASIIILTVISLERYFAIIYPMLSKRVSRMCLVKIIVVVVWIITIGYGIPNLIGYDTVDFIQPDNSTLSFCVKKKAFSMEPYILINFVLWYLVPLVLMTCMYTKISIVLWRSSIMGQEMANTGRRKYKEAGESHPLKELKPPVRDSATDMSDIDNVERPKIVITNGMGEERPASLKLDDMERREDRKIDYRRVALSNRKPIACPCMRMSKKGKSGGSNNIGQNNSGYSSKDEMIVKLKPNNNESSIFKRKHKKKKEENNPILARRKVIRLLMAIIVSFAVVVLPHHIRLLWQTFTRRQSFTFTDQLVPPITLLIFFLNSCLNPFLYAFLSDNFRKAFRELNWRHCSVDRRQGSPISSKSHNTMQTLQSTPSPMLQKSLLSKSRSFTTQGQ